MICPKCGNDKFSVVNVFRNKIYRNEHWVYSSRDTRLIICDDCGNRYFTETEIIAEIKFDSSAFRKFIQPLDEHKKDELRLDL